MRFLVLGAEHAVGRGELGHDQAAAAQIADEAAEDGIGDARHGREHGGRSDLHRAKLEPLAQARLRGAGALARGRDRIVPVLAHCLFYPLGRCKPQESKE